MPLMGERESKFALTDACRKPLVLHRWLYEDTVSLNWEWMSIVAEIFRFLGYLRVFFLKSIAV